MSLIVDHVRINNPSFHVAPVDGVSYNSKAARAPAKALCDVGYRPTQKDGDPFLTLVL